jgi:hypothetical protein
MTDKINTVENNSLFKTEDWANRLKNEIKLSLQTKERKWMSLRLRDRWTSAEWSEYWTKWLKSYRMKEDKDMAKNNHIPVMGEFPRVITI